MVALLRGVNVGGKNKLPMAELRAIAEGCGFEQVRTHIQSGNLVFEAGERTSALVAAELHEAIAAATGLEPNVIVRTAAELSAVVTDNPFRRRGELPEHLHVLFADDEANLQLPDLTQHAPEEASVSDCDVYLLLPSGVGRSKLADELTRKLVPTGTLRNWRTVTKLAEMAAETIHPTPS